MHIFNGNLTIKTGTAKSTDTVATKGSGTKLRYMLNNSFVKIYSLCYPGEAFALATFRQYVITIVLFGLLTSASGIIYESALVRVIDWQEPTAHYTTSVVVCFKEFF